MELYLRFEHLAHGNFILSESITDYMLVEINYDVIKLKIKLDDYFDDVSIKFEEIDSSWLRIEIEQQENRWYLDVNGEKRCLIIPTDMPIELCTNYLYIGKSEVIQYIKMYTCILLILHNHK